MKTGTVVGEENAAGSATAGTSADAIGVMGTVKSAALEVARMACTPEGLGAGAGLVPPKPLGEARMAGVAEVSTAAGVAETTGFAGVSGLDRADGLAGRAGVDDEARLAGRAAERKSGFDDEARLAGRAGVDDEVSLAGRAAEGKSGFDDEAVAVFADGSIGTAGSLGPKGVRGVSGILGEEGPGEEKPRPSSEGGRGSFDAEALPRRPDWSREA